MVPGCGRAVSSWTVGMVRSNGVLSWGDVVVMGTVVVTTLHPQGPGKLELAPLPEAVSPSSVDSSRTVCKHSEPLCTVPTNTVPGSFPSGERLRLPKRSAVNSRLPKQMVSPGASPVLVKLLPLATKVSFSE
jgi:hypothetical protein